MKIAENQTHLTTMQEWNGQEVIYKHGTSTDKSGYDLRGNRTKMTTVSLSPSFSHPTKYEYTDLGQLAKLTDQLDGVTSYEYDNMGLVQTTTYPNGTYTTYEYDSDRYWLTNITHKKSNQTVIGSFTYGYDTGTVGKNGTRTSVSEYQLKPDSNTITATVAYGYDDLYRLTSEVRTGDVPYSKSYYYDLAGNRTSMVDGATTTTCTYDDANKLLSAAVTGGSTTTYKYDGAGNQRTATTGSDVTTYTWGFKNMMTKWEKTGETTVEYGYDGRGMRVVSAPSGGVAILFLMDGREIAERISSENVTSYVSHGFTSQISDTTRLIYHFDGIGSTRAMTDGSQAVAEAGVYDAYGNLKQDYPGSSAPSFGFAGQIRYFADQTGLDYLKARYYDPHLGCFISRDPLGLQAGNNLYQYAWNNPMGFTDPTGEVAWGVILPIIAIGYTVYEAVCLYRAWEAGNEVANTGNDKQAHCLMACRIKRCLNTRGIPIIDGVTNYVLYLGMWLWELMGGVYDPADVVAGVVGLGCSYCPGSCGSCCAAALSKPDCPFKCK